jgi:acetoin:2,6-dichlorophenolindophenol oxidoreductase subunit beta
MATAATVAETIRAATAEHLKSRNGLLFGQCVTAVGWIGGTVPELTEADGIIELPASDCSNAGVVCGVALAGRRPIYAVRYQGFLWLNLSYIVNYASKSKEMWGVPCPVFVRAIGMEGAIGPVASGNQHSMAMRMPGIIVAAPMTPTEWQEIWDYFLDHDDPVLCSEHRLSFPINYEITDQHHSQPDVSFFPISAARLRVREAVVDLGNMGYCCDVNRIVWLKPLKITDKMLNSLGNSRFGVVVDSDFATCGASQAVAHELMLATGRPVYTLGLEDRTAGFAPHADNLTPSVQKIKALTLKMLEKHRG